MDAFPMARSSCCAPVGVRAGRITKAYLGDDKPGDASNLHFPSYGPEAATLLVQERHVRLIGVDTASVDNGPSHDLLVHRIVAAADVGGLENLTNLEQLPPTGAWVVALPIKIAGGPADRLELSRCCRERTEAGYCGFSRLKVSEVSS